MLGARLAHQVLLPEMAWTVFVYEISSRKAEEEFSLPLVVTNLQDANPTWRLLHLVIDELQATVDHDRPYAGTKGLRNKQSLSLAIHRCATDFSVGMSTSSFFVIITYACTTVNPSNLAGSEWTVPSFYALQPLESAAAAAMLRSETSHISIDISMWESLLPLLGGNPRAIRFLINLLRTPASLEAVWDRLVQRIERKWNSSQLNSSPLIPLLALSGLCVHKEKQIANVKIAELPKLGFAELVPVTGSEGEVVIRMPPVLLWASLSTCCT